VNDLRPGEKVTVSYKDAQSVLIADQVKQDPMEFEGKVAAIDTSSQMLTLHRIGLDKQLQIAAGCIIILHNDMPGTLADIKPGDHVTATYEIPEGVPTARQIAQTSMEFTGKLTALDVGAKTLKGKALFNSRKFNVANNCAIVINGKTDGQLGDLKPNDQLVFTYDTINGINVVNRIAPREAISEPATTASNHSPDFGVPLSYPY